MKRLNLIFLVLLFLLNLPSIFSQHNKSTNSPISELKEIQKNNRFYATGSFAIGNANSHYGFGFTYVNGNNWGLNASVALTDLGKITYFPDDKYNYSFTRRIYYLPKKGLSNISLRMVREFSVFKDRARLGIEVGPSFVTMTFPEYLLIEIPFVRYYDVIYQREHALGLTMKLKAEVPFTSFASVTLATVANINKFQSFYGAELSFNFGKIR